MRAHSSSNVWGSNFGDSFVTLTRVPVIDPFDCWCLRSVHVYWFVTDKPKPTLLMSAQFILSAAQRYASAVLAGSCGPVSARLSIINRCSLETAWRINWFLVWTLTSTSPMPCFKENILASPNKDTFLWNFVPNSGLRTCHHDNRSSQAVVNNAYRRSSFVDHACDDRRTVVRPLCYTLTAHTVRYTSVDRNTEHRTRKWRAVCSR